MCLISMGIGGNPTSTAYLLRQAFTVCMPAPITLQTTRCLCASYFTLVLRCGKGVTLLTNASTWYSWPGEVQHGYYHIMGAQWCRRPSSHRVGRTRPSRHGERR